LRLFGGPRRLPERSRMTDLVINGRFLAQQTTGVQRVAREITREIDAILTEGDLGISARLVCEPGANLDDLSLSTISVETASGLSGHLWEQLTLPRAVRGAHLLCLGNSAPAWSLMSDLPVGVVIHDLSYRLYPQAYRPAYRFAHSMLMPLLLWRADPLITVSQSESVRLASLTRRRQKPVIVAQNGSWRASLQAALAPHERAALPDPGFLLYVGALSQRKNIAGLFESAVRLAREDGLRFLFIGTTASIHTDMELVVPDDLTDKIIFLGHIEDGAFLSELYRRAACLVFPSFYEASPLPPLEAMHFGCPVVVSDIPALKERCGDAAEYCDPHDISSIVGAVRHVLNNPARKDELVQRGRVRARTFTWRNQAEIILSAMMSAGERVQKPL